MKLLISFLFLFIGYIGNAQRIDSVKILGPSSTPANHVHVFFTTNNFNDLHDRFTIDSSGGIMDLKFYWNTCGIFLPANWNYDTLVAIPTNIISNMNLSVRTFLDSNTVDSSCAFINTPNLIDSFFLFPQALNRYDIDQFIKLYPNPVRKILQLNFTKGLLLKELNIFNYIGQELKIVLEDNQIDVSHLPNGLYLLRITTNKGLLTKKVIISN